MNNDWKNVYPEVPQSFHETVQRTLDTQVINKTERKKVMKKRFPIALAAVITALGVTTATATYVIQWNSKIAERFGADEQMQSELVSAGALAPVDQTVTVNGLTVTALQTLGDKNGIYMLFDVKAPEGILLDECRFGPKVNVEGANNRVSSCSGFKDQTGTSSTSGAANERYYELWLINGKQEDLNGKTITVEFGDLEVDNGTVKPDVVLSGPWKLSWKLSYMDNTQTFSINKTYDVNGHNIVVNSVELSPLSLKIDLSGDGLKQLIDHSDLDTAGSLLSPTLTLHNTKAFDIYDSSGPGSERHTDTTYTLTQSFGKILDVDQVASLNLTFPWEKSNNTLTVTLP
ncbi:MAG: hypothetical protein BWY74_00802 [Firmicutes bacterium ADurb.Bin419]|nr:MAG: hypothetical protein BWY74_00802 [Firmicutes bacterium ADurb.Bin419]